MNVTVSRTIDKGAAKHGRFSAVHFDVLVDGALVASSDRKWIAQAMADAVAAGHITVNGGDLQMQFLRWASVHARQLLDRLPDNF